MGSAPAVRAGLGGPGLVGLAPFAPRLVSDESRLLLAAEGRVGVWDDRLGEGPAGLRLRLALRTTVLLEADVRGRLVEALAPRRVSLLGDSEIVRALRAEVFSARPLAAAFARLALVVLLEALFPAVDRDLVPRPDFDLGFGAVFFFALRDVAAALALRLRTFFVFPVPNLNLRPQVTPRRNVTYCQ